MASKMNYGATLLMKQLAELSKNPNESFSVGMDGENIFKWNVLVVGPPDSMYEGGFLYILCICNLVTRFLLFIYFMYLYGGSRGNRGAAKKGKCGGRWLFSSSLALLPRSFSLLFSSSQTQNTSTCILKMNSLFSFSDLYCLHVAHEIFSYAGSFDKRPLRQPENKIRNYNKLI